MFYVIKKTLLFWWVHSRELVQRQIHAEGVQMNSLQHERKTALGDLSIMRANKTTQRHRYILRSVNLLQFINGNTVRPDLQGL